MAAKQMTAFTRQDPFLWHIPEHLLAEIARRPFSQPPEYYQKKPSICIFLVE